MTISVIPTLIRFNTLFTGDNLDFFRLLLHTIKVPDVIVDPLGIPLGSFSYIIHYKRVFFIVSMCHDIDVADIQLATTNDVILKTGIFYELVIDRRSILNFVEIVTRLRFA